MVISGVPSTNRSLAIATLTNWSDRNRDPLKFLMKLTKKQSYP